MRTYMKAANNNDTQIHLSYNQHYLLKILFTSPHKQSSLKTAFSIHSSKTICFILLYIYNNLYNILTTFSYHVTSPNKSYFPCNTCTKNLWVILGLFLPHKYLPNIDFTDFLRSSSKSAVAHEKHSNSHNFSFQTAK